MFPSLGDLDPQQLQLLTSWLGGSLALLAYHLWRPDVRPNLLRAIILIVFAGFLLRFAVTVSIATTSLPAWAQTLAHDLQMVPGNTIAAWICWVAGKSQGAKHPYLGPFCRSAPYVFVASWASLTAFTLVFPSTYIDESPASTSHFWALKVYSAMIVAYLVAGAAIFGKEALRQRESPSLARRVQNAFLFLGCCSAISNVAVIVTISVLQNSSDSSVFAASYLPLAQQMTVLTLIAAGVFYMGGLLLYQSNEENERIHARLRKWVAFRHDLEVEFDEAWNVVGNKFTDRYFHKAARDPSVRLSKHDKEKAASLVKLLGYLSHSPRARAPRVNHLSRLQSQLAFTTDLASRLIVKAEGDITYDLKQDSLYAATKPALFMAQEKTRPSLLGEQDWVQLAAVAAADAGYLSPEKAGPILSPPAKAVKGSILEAYIFAKLIEEAL